VSPRRDLTFGVQAGLRAPSTSRDGSAEQRVLVDSQLRRLRSWEDPANQDPVARVYRWMCFRADAAVALRSTAAGEYGACPKPGKAATG